MACSPILLAAAIFAVLPLLVNTEDVVLSPGVPVTSFLHANTTFVIDYDASDYELEVVLSTDFPIWRLSCKPFADPNFPSYPDLRLEVVREDRDASALGYSYRKFSCGWEESVV